ncbi:MAG: glycoside hydrolase family 5 protein [Solirubrobacteraceae bacterium]
MRAVLALLAGLALGLGAGGSRALGSRALESAPLAISVSGNQFVNQDEQPVRLLGVDEESTEYACYYGYGYSNDELDAAGATAIADWHANAVRIPLNEDCWLGINGLPAGSLTAAGYRAAIENYVEALRDDGIYAILDLHWSADGSAQSDGQREMPDDNSARFWTSVATAFLDDPAVLFDVFNEPEGADGFAVSWSCWRSGGCTVPNVADGTSVTDPPTYEATGMQTLVDAIRATGATQPILIGGLNYANDLRQWLANEPEDPSHQLAASFHNYTGEDCDTETCWDQQIAPVAAHVPVVTGEFDEDDCPAGGGTDPNNFDNSFMDWADANGVSYLAWGWLALPQPQSCSAMYLITDGAGYTPADPNGVALQDHLATLAAAQSGVSSGASTTNTAPTTSMAPTTSTSTSSTSTPTTPLTTPTTSPTTPPTTPTTSPTTTATNTPTTLPATPTTSPTTTATNTLTTPTTETTGSRPTPRTALEIALGSLKLTGNRLSGRASTERAFSGRIAVTVTVLIASGTRQTDRRPVTTRVLRTHVAITHGTCDFAITLPRGARVHELLASYPGGPRFASVRLIRLTDLPVGLAT